MKPATQNWVDKAEADIATAKHLLRVRKSPNYDAVCGFAQQAAEKYMKAVLIEEGREFKYRHDLAYLLSILVKVNELWEFLHLAAQFLTDNGVRFRYPGNSADKQMARDAVKAADLIRDRMREHLKIDEPAQSKKKKKKKKTSRKVRKKRG
jgi:HEPN domain-containing protein